MVRGLLAAAGSSSGAAAPRSADAPMMALPSATPLPGQEELGASLGTTQLPFSKKPKALVNKCENKIKVANEKIDDMDTLIEEMQGNDQMCHGSTNYKTPSLSAKASCEPKP